MQSKFLTEKLLQGMAPDTSEDEPLAGRNADRLEQKETIVLMDSRKPTESLANITFQFKTPVKSDAQQADSIINSVQDSIMSGELDVMSRIMGQLGLGASKAQSRVSNTITTNLGKYSRYRKSKSDSAFRDGRGKFVSEMNLRNALKLATIANVVQDMKSPGNNGLVYRTGRLQYSIDLKPLTLKDNKLSIFYTYMVRPYSVFDPQVSRYRDLSSSSRNPQKLITEQLQKQATQLGIRRYKLDIKQHWRRGG